MNVYSVSGTIRLNNEYTMHWHRYIDANSEIGAHIKARWEVCAQHSIASNDGRCRVERVILLRSNDNGQ